MQPLPFQNAHYDRKLLRVLVAELFRLLGSDHDSCCGHDSSGSGPPMHPGRNHRVGDGHSPP